MRKLSFVFSLVLLLGVAAVVEAQQTVKLLYRDGRVAYRTLEPLGAADVADGSDVVSPLAADLGATIQIFDASFTEILQTAPLGGHITLGLLFSNTLGELPGASFDQIVGKRLILILLARGGIVYPTNRPAFLGTLPIMPGDEDVIAIGSPEVINTPSQRGFFFALALARIQQVQVQNNSDFGFFLIGDPAPRGAAGR